MAPRSQVNVESDLVLVPGCPGPVLLAEPLHGGVSVEVVEVRRIRLIRRGLLGGVVPQDGTFEFRRVDENDIPKAIFPFAPDRDGDLALRGLDEVHPLLLISDLRPQCLQFARELLEERGQIGMTLE